MSHLASIVEDAWNAAVANPDYRRWGSLADMAAQIANALYESDPNNLMVVTHRAIYAEARARMIAMEPSKEIAA